MVIVKMTENEYKAYQLYLKSIKVMLKPGKKSTQYMSLEDYLSDPKIIQDLEEGIHDVNEGNITYITPDNIWESIK